MTLSGDASLASGSLTVDAKGLLVNFGGDLNLGGGTLLTDENTNFHLLDNSTLTTNAEQVIGNITIPQGEEPMLTLSGSNTKLKVVQLITVTVACPQSLPVEPKAQLRLPGGVRINTGGELCIDGWLEGDIVLDGGTLQIDANTSISSASAISIASDSELKLADGASLTYEGDSINLNANKLSVSGGGSLVLKTDGSNPLTLNDKDSEIEFSGNSAAATTTVSHVKINAGDTSNMPVLRMTESGVIKNLSQQEFAEVNFASGKKLTLEQNFVVPSGKQMNISGAAGILKTASSISLAGTFGCFWSKVIHGGRDGCIKRRYTPG